MIMPQQLIDVLEEDESQVCSEDEQLEVVEEDDLADNIIDCVFDDDGDDDDNDNRH